MDEITADLRFDSYHLNRIVLERNPDEQNSQSKLYDMRFQVHFEYDEAAGKAKVLLAVDVCPDYLKQNFPFHLEVDVEGRFGFRLPVEFGKAKSLIEHNAVAILFPYVRAAVTTITAAANVPPLILPPVNIIRMLEENRKGEG